MQSLLINEITNIHEESVYDVQKLQIELLVNTKRWKWERVISNWKKRSDTSNLLQISVFTSFTQPILRFVNRQDLDKFPLLVPNSPGSH